MALFYRPEPSPLHTSDMCPSTAQHVDAELDEVSALAHARSFVEDCVGPLASFDVQHPGARQQHLTYGEISLETFSDVLRAARHARKEAAIRRFCDVGSGRGAAVLAAAVLLPDVVEAFGVEVDEAAARAGEAAVRASADHPFRPLAAESIVVRRADALADRTLWRGADLIYACWTAFPADLRATFARAFAEDATPGALLAVLSHPLSPPASDAFALEATLSVACSWAPRVPCYLYAKH